MVNADTTYLRQMQQQWGYSAAWLPTTHFELGAYGTMDGKEFEKLGTINKWVVSKSTSRPSGTMYYVSTGNTHVSVDFGAADITKQMGVDITIQFDKKSSIFFLGAEYDHHLDPKPRTGG